VLSKLDENAAVPFQDLQCTVGASFVTFRKQSGHFGGIVHFLPLIQRRAVA
jgi:hypothetical protein